MTILNETKLSSELKRKLTGALLRYYREDENMTINFVAESLGINKGYLSEIEHFLNNHLHKCSKNLQVLWTYVLIPMNLCTLI